MTNSILKQQIFMPFFILLLVAFSYFLFTFSCFLFTFSCFYLLLVAFSCLNLYLKKEKVCSYLQLLYYLKKEKTTFTDVIVSMSFSLFLSSI